MTSTLSASVTTRCSTCPRWSVGPLTDPQRTPWHGPVSTSTHRPSRRPLRPLRLPNASGTAHPVQPDTWSLRLVIRQVVGSSPTCPTALCSSAPCASRAGVAGERAPPCPGGPRDRPARRRSPRGRGGCAPPAWLGRGCSRRRDRVGGVGGRARRQRPAGCHRPGRGSRQPRTLPPSWTPGLAVAVKHLLRAGVVLLGLQLVLSQVASLGPRLLAVVVVVVAVGLVSTLALGRLLRTGRDLTLLVACGFSICGAAAVAAADTVVEAEEEDVVTAIALVVLFGTLMIPALPAAVLLLGLSADQGATWAGTAIHEVAQVVAAGEAIGSTSASTAGGALLALAVTVKLARVVMLAPVVAALRLRDRRHAGVGGPGVGRPSSRCSSSASSPSPWCGRPVSSRRSSSRPADSSRSRCSPQRCSPWGPASGSGPWCAPGPARSPSPRCRPW